MEQGWLTSALGIVEDTRYYTDTRFVLKQRKDIQRNTFSVNLSRSTTIRVPLDTAGNLGGLYEASRDDPRYFRVVNLEDSVFEKRGILFQLDASYLDAFKSTINFVTVNFRKQYADQPEVSRSLVFNHDDVAQGRTLQEVLYPRLGATESDWRDYEYQLRWSVRDRPTIAVPPDEAAWTRSQDPAVSLVPPFQRRVIEIDADRAVFDEHGVRAAIVEFNSTLAGQPYRNARARLRAADAESTTRLALFHDRDAEVTWRVTWHTKGGTRREAPQKLDTDYLLILPPGDLAAGSGTD
jgi:hypothetical protein